MTEYEAYDLALNFIEFGHDLGEAVLSQIQFWAGVSYALLAITLVAPKTLTIGTTALLLALYIVFSANTITNIGFDMDTAVASRHDARKILSDQGLSLEVVEEKLRIESDTGLPVARNITNIYAPALFIGTIAYMAYVCRREHIAKKNKNVS